jgi:tetratricopeptide (TPR) repeat protein
VAEAIFRRVADEPTADSSGLPNRIQLASFLARRGRVKEAIDNCELLWADKARREPVTAVCTGILCGSKASDPEQVRRVIGWLERARADAPRSMIFPLALGNLYERLSEYPRAEQMYRDAIKLDDRDGIASNNLAWLLTLEGGDKAREATDLIRNAIRARGPLPEFLDTRGMIFLKAGQGDRAVEDLEKALKGAPSPPKYFHLAQAYLGVNQKEKARKALEAGRSQGLPDGLHPLEQTVYNEVTSALGRP